MHDYGIGFRAGSWYLRPSSICASITAVDQRVARAPTGGASTLGRIGEMDMIPLSPVCTALSVIAAVASASISASKGAPTDAIC